MPDSAPATSSASVGTHSQSESQSLPDSARMPPPSQTPSERPSRKRKRDADDQYSAASSERSAVKGSTSFPPSVIRYIRQQKSSDACWNCGATPTHCAHVIPQAEDEISDLESKGFLPPSFCSSIENAILLCPLCHANFDRLHNPGFVFLPSDLQYFIDCAKRDLKKRQEILDQGERVRGARVVPSREDYQKHCALALGEAGGSGRDSPLDPEALGGGLYLRYTLTDFYPKGLTQHLGPNPYQEKKAWAGLPYAALRRGFHALGTKAGMFPRKVRSQLRRLSDLYDKEPRRRGSGGIDTSEDEREGSDGTYDGDNSGKSKDEVAKGEEAGEEGGQEEAEQQLEGQGTGPHRTVGHGDCHYALADKLPRAEGEGNSVAAAENKPVSQASTLVDHPTSLLEWAQRQQGQEKNATWKYGPEATSQEAVERKGIIRAVEAAVVSS